MFSKKTILSIVVAILYTASYSLSADTWSVYTKTNDIQSISVQGNYIWCNTMGGVVRWDRRDSTYVKYSYIFSDSVGAYLSSFNYDIAADSLGNVWVGKHLSTFEYTFDTWRIMGAGLFVTMFVPNDGTLWAFGENGCMAHYNGSVWYWYPQQDFFASCMSEDRTGFLWLGTIDRLTGLSPEGVRCWTGSEFIQYTSADGLLDNYVGGIVIDADNVKWFRTGRGLSRFDGVTWINYPLPDSTAFLWGSLAQSKDGAFWTLGTGGLYRFDGSEWQILPLPEGYTERSNSYSTKLEFDDDGILWFGMEKGLLRFDGNSWSCWREQDGPAINFCSGLFTDSRNGKWFSHSTGIDYFDGSNWTFFPGSSGTHIIEDQNRVVWFAYYQHNIWSFDGKSVVNYTFSGDDIAVDSQNVKWTTKGGTITGGLYSLSNGEWVKECDVKVGGHPQITIDRNDVKWIYSGLYVFCYDGVTLKKYTSADGLYSLKSISGLLAGTDNSIWCISDDRLMRFDGGKWVDRTGDIPGATTASFFDDATIMQWVNTDAGLWKYENGVWTQPIPPASLPGEVKGVRDDPNGTMWLVLGDYLCNWNGAELKTFTSDDGLLPSGASKVVIDKDGVKWLNGFITRFKEDTPVSVESFCGLPRTFSLLANHPNPFNPSTTLSFTLPQSGRSELSIYSITGQRVRTLFSGPLTAGAHSVIWDGRDDSGKPVSSGVYISRLTSGKQTATGRMVLLR